MEDLAKLLQEPIYKLASRREWREAQEAGQYRGSKDDVRDGYIHFSRAGQVKTTAQKYFSTEQDLVLICFHASELGPALKFEPARDGQLFPHLYGALNPQLAVKVSCIPYNNGQHDFTGSL